MPPYTPTHQCKNMHHTQEAVISSEARRQPSVVEIPCVFPGLPHLRDLRRSGNANLMFAPSLGASVSPWSKEFQSPLAFSNPFKITSSVSRANSSPANS